MLELAIETGLGAFFASSGYHKLFNPERRRVFIATLAEDLPRVRLGWSARLMDTALPIGELASGAVALLAVPLAFAGLSLATDLALLAMLGILAGAIACEGVQRVAAYKPLDLADRVSDWEYLPEVLLAALAVVAFLI
jgi:hypothetical protein